MKTPINSSIFWLFISFIVYSTNIFADPSAHLLSRAPEITAAEKYVQEKIINHTERAKTELERLETKMNAKNAFTQKDWYSSRYALYRVLADNPKDFQAWLLLAHALSEMTAYDNVGNDLRAATVIAYQHAKTDLDKASVEWFAAKSNHEFYDLKAKALQSFKQNELETHIQTQLQNYPTEFAPWSINVPKRSDIGSVCIDWTYPLLKTHHFNYDQYVSITPKVRDLAVIARNSQLCLEGLTFGEHYQIKLKKDLPGLQDKKLIADHALSVHIPHRKPSIRFREKGYLLPSSAPQLLPLVAVNVASVQLKVIHVPERNIQSIQNNWFANRFARWDADYLQNEQGDVVWQGQYHFPTENDKTLLSGVPIDKIIGKKLTPGVYVVEARIKENSYDDDDFAAQALVISDIGLSAYQGQDGLHVYARSLKTAKPLKHVEVRLIARNNREIAKSITDQSGYALFAPQLIHGQSGNSPSYLTATVKGAEFTVLNLRTESFDLSDRGSMGKDPSGAMDIFLYTERGIYRPQETVHISALLRDKKGHAITAMPLTLKLFRPDGMLAHESIIKDQGHGSYQFDFKTSNQIQSGQWIAALYVDSKQKEISHVRFIINDFVPPRIEAKATSTAKILKPFEKAAFDVSAQYYFGPPGSKLKVESTSKLIACPKPFTKWQSYYFGLVEEPFTAVQFKNSDGKTDEQGKASINTTIAISPQTTHPLQLETSVQVFETGGRSVTTKNTVFFWHQPCLIGIEPQFKDHEINSHSQANFKIIALNEQGELLAKSNLKYTLFEEEHDYIWYRHGVDWQYESVFRDKVIASGNVTLADQSPTPLSLPVQYGRYRIELLDEKSGVATSYRFNAGWSAVSDMPNKPDRLNLAFTPDAKNPKQTKVHVQSPFAGELFLAWADQTFKPVYNGKINKTTEITIPVNPSNGSYLLATVYRGGDDSQSQMPNRAIGLNWLADHQSKDKRLDFSLEHAKTIQPNKSIEIKVKAKQHERYYVRVALVDEGTLSLTDYASPDPFAYFFSQSRLAYNLYDNYGALINPYGVRPGSFEVGGGETILNHALKTLPTRAFKVVSLQSAMVESDAQGIATIPFDIPQYTGKLRVMAVAWNDAHVGGAKSEIIVRDDIDLYLASPRFLAPKDTTNVPLIINNESGAEGDYLLEVTAENLNMQKKIRLKQRTEHKEILTLHYKDNGIKNIKVKLTSPQKQVFNRQYSLAVRSKVPTMSLQQYGRLEPGQTLTLDNKLTDNFDLENTKINIDWRSIPELGSKQQIKELLQYPYHCLEQTTSRLIATLYSDTVNQEKLDPIFNHLASLQKIDGSFALWSQSGQSQAWLSLYAYDALMQAQEKGYTIPKGIQQQTLNWIKEIVGTSVNHDEDIAILAYAHYLLAKENQGELQRLRFFADHHKDKIKQKHDLAFIAGAFAHYQDKENATRWFDKAIESTAQPNRYWQFGSPLRDTAVLISVIGKTMANHHKLPALAQALLDNAKDTPYLSTQEKSWLILADASLIQLKSDYTLEYQNKRVSGTEQHFELNANTLGQTFKNTSNKPIFYRLSVSGEPVDTQKLPQQGFELTSNIYTLEGSPITTKSFKSGERYIIQIAGRKLKPEINHVLLVSLLPAGFEIEETRSDWLDTRPQPSRVEARDDRFVSAFELRDDSDFNIAYIVRAVSSGTFVYPSAMIEAMYQPQYFKFTQEEKMDVTAS